FTGGSFFQRILANVTRPTMVGAVPVACLCWSIHSCCQRAVCIGAFRDRCPSSPPGCFLPLTPIWRRARAVRRDRGSGVPSRAVQHILALAQPRVRIPLTLVHAYSRPFERCVLAWPRDVLEKPR